MDVSNGKRLPVGSQSPEQTNSSSALSKEDQKLKESSQEFESVFISMMLSQMRNNTVMKSDLFGKGQEEEVWNSMMDQELAKSWAKNEGVGLANLLFQQLRQPTGQ